MKVAQPRILSKILLVYSIALSVVLFPFAQAHDAWGVYAVIVLLAFILTFGMFRLAKNKSTSK